MSDTAVDSPVATPTTRLYTRAPYRKKYEGAVDGDIVAMRREHGVPILCIARELGITRYAVKQYMDAHNIQ